MKHLFKSLLSLIVLTAAMAPQADAQLVTYQFTGTVTYGSEEVGNTIAGLVTLDVGAAPDAIYDIGEDGVGQYGVWSTEGFSINGVTDTGFAAGTSFGGDTTFYNGDLPLNTYQYNFIRNELSDGNHSRMIELGDYSKSSSGDGVTSLPNPWNPLAVQDNYIYVADYDYTTGTFEFGTFSIDSFTIQPSTVIINGRDTGMKDFEYQGKLVSKYLEEFAASSRNQGGYISSVAKLTNDLKKAGLITNEQKNLIMTSVNESRIGK